MTTPLVVDPVVSPDWLYDNLDQPGIQVIENAGIPDSYLKAHIAGAICLPCHPHLKQLDAAGEITQHLMPAAEFAALCHEIGLRRDTHYVIYDDRHGLYAARFRAVARHYGLDNLSILDGSWHGWLDQGRPVTTRLEEATAGSDVVISARPSLLIAHAELQRVYRDMAVQIWDTRRTEEFTGIEETDNRRVGHIPGARHLSWTDLLSGEDIEGEPRYVKPRAELEHLLAQLGLRRDKTVVTYCQSGIRAAFCQLVLETLGYRRHRLYDASMGEWANLPTTPLTSDPT